MIIPNSPKILDNDFFNKKFANKYHTDRHTLRIGNIISFISPVKMVINEKICESTQSLNFCLEIPETNNYAGVAIQQLFITNVGNILSKKEYTDCPMEITNTDIILKKEHSHGGINQLDGVVSMNYIKNLNGTILIYLGLYNDAGESAIPRAFSLHLREDVCYKFMDEVNAMFYHLVNNLFINTAKM